MNLTRLHRTDDTTIGYLKFEDFGCFSLEDIPREPKIPGKTRIPAGTYKLALRTEGALAKKYLTRYSWHKGMLWLQDVPNFEWVYLHIGNSHLDTEGCILVGNSANLSARPANIMDSTQAYIALYHKVITAMAKRSVTITITDEA